ncbi:glycosyltransferase family 2 protein [Dongia sp.]|uniref:glycosyltransferase n=1 Tax=Dongia sp. TaxID=1977262 RepID=UPI0035B3288D
MDISLIVCTRNRAAQLGPCLAHIASVQYSGPWELIVVDNGSSDNTAEVIDEFARQAAFLVRYVPQPVKGLGNARNAGLTAARGRIVAFTDDDCYVAPDFLQATMHAFDNSRIGYVTGRISLHDPTDYPATINESRVPRAFPRARYLPPGALMGANMAFRRDVLIDIGGFDPLFGAGALFPAEDCDAAARASLAGWDGCYDPNIVVAHHHGRKADSIPQLQRDYDIGRGAYHAKLMLSCGAVRHGLRGWGRLVTLRLRRRPASAYWESYGALGYAWQWLSGRTVRATDRG